MAAQLTKEQLKNELISHGVQPPVQSARKEEFVKLYEQHVAPIVAQKGDFSSDEEDATNENQEQTTNNSLVCNGVDVASMSDEDLYAQLQSFGVPVGPILETTRSVYQRKLAALLHNGVAAVEPEQTNGNGNIEEEKFSDSEEEQDSPVKHEEKEDSPIVVPAEPVISTPEPLTAIRKRVTERPPSSLNALPLVDRQGTPTPRPSIRSFTGPSQLSYESRRVIQQDTIDSPPQKAPNGKIIRYVLILVAFLAAAYIAYSYGDCVKQVVENARQKVFQYVEKAENIAEKIDHAKPNPMPDV